MDIYGLMGIILIGVVFSWVNPHAPMAPFIYALGDPCCDRCGALFH